MKAEIITIGDELLIGQVVDTNSAYMARKLEEWGISVYQVTSVHDNAAHIRQALTDALSRVDIVLCTGGLGPTKDDITKATFCAFFHTELVEDKAVKAHIERLYANRPQVLNRLTATQWQVPANCTIIPNHVGSAPIMYWNQESGATNQDKIVIALPGVPYEMEYAFEHEVGELLRNLAQAEAIEHRTFLVTGIAESELAILLEDWENNLPEGTHLAYLPKDGIIRLRIDGEAAPLQAFKALIAPYLITEEDKPLEVLIGEHLKANGQTICSAESCTGGKIAEALNRHAGSSAFYMGSVVAYDNSIKEKVLGVSQETLITHGAVSETCVREMAEGARTLMKTDYALATSGIAGSTGGTDEKPVGTVWIALATPTETIAKRFHCGRLRDQITTRATTQALVMLLRYLHSELQNL